MKKMMPGESKYLLAHKEDLICFLSINLNQESFSHRIFKNYLGLPLFRDDLLVFEKGHQNWYCNAKMWKEVSNAVARKIDTDQNFSRKLVRGSLRAGRALHQQCYQVINDLKQNKLDDKIWPKIFESFFQLCALGLGAVMSDLQHRRLSNALDEIIQEKIQKFHLKRSLGDYIGILVKSQVPNHHYSAKEKLLEIIDKITREKVEKKFTSLLAASLEDYLYRFAWVDYGHLGPALSLKGLIDRIKLNLKNKKERGELREAVDQKRIGILQNKYRRELHLNAREKNLFRAASDFNGIKAYRSQLMFLTFYTIDLVLNKLSKELKVPMRTLQNVTRQEFVFLVKNRRLPVKTKILHARYNFSVIWAQDLNKVKIFTGQEAKKFIRVNLPRQVEVRDVSIIKGHVAFSGKVIGVVKIVAKINDLSKIMPGDILVAEQTMPQYLPAMKKAAAFVTDVGGITSHAAIVAREMKKPCIIATEIATKVLRDGDLVEVDATKGVVKKI